MRRWGIRGKQGKIDCGVVGRPSLASRGKKKHIAPSFCSASFRAKTFKCASCCLFPPVPPHAVGAGAPCEAPVKKQQPLLFDKEKKNKKNKSQKRHFCHLSQDIYKTQNRLHARTHSMSQPGCLNSHHSLLPLAGDVGSIHLSKCITESVDLYLKVFIILITAQWNQTLQFWSVHIRQQIHCNLYLNLFNLTAL